MFDISMEEQPWDVTLLGTRSAGKTCYLGCFYHHFGNNSANNSINRTDFSVYAPDPYLRGQLEEFADSVSANPVELPAGTIGVSPFPLDFALTADWAGRRHNFTKRMSLIDHEGEALKGTTDKEKAQKHSRVLDELKSADGFIAFLSTEHLLKGAAGERDAEWQTMCHVIDHVSKKVNLEDRVPVTIVLSKFDLAQDSGREEEAFERAKEMIKKFSATKENVTFMLCPINVMRTDGNGRNIPEPDPTNIAAPFLFTASGVIMRNARMLQYFANEQKEKAASMQQEIDQRNSENKGIFGFLRRAFPNIKSRFNMHRYDNAANRHINLSHIDLAFAENSFREISMISDTGSICFIHDGNIVTSIGDYMQNYIRPQRYV